MDLSVWCLILSVGCLELSVGCLEWSLLGAWNWQLGAGFVHTGKVLHFLQTVKLETWVVWAFLSNVLVPGPVQMRRDRRDIVSWLAKVTFGWALLASCFFFEFS